MDIERLKDPEYHFGKDYFQEQIINASVSKVFQTLIDCNTWDTWSPWEEYLTNPDETKPEENDVLIAVPVK